MIHERATRKPSIAIVAPLSGQSLRIRADLADYCDARVFMTDHEAVARSFGNADYIICSPRVRHSATEMARAKVGRWNVIRLRTASGAGIVAAAIEVARRHAAGCPNGGDGRGASP